MSPIASDYFASPFTVGMSVVQLDLSEWNTFFTEVSEEKSPLNPESNCDNILDIQGLLLYTQPKPKKCFLPQGFQSYLRH